MPNKIIKRYFDVVPLFRYKELELEQRLSLIFYVIGFCLSFVAFTTTLLLGMPIWINMPNVLILFLCIFLPFAYPNDFVKLATLMLYFLAFIYLPLTYFINGGHNGVGLLYFLLATIYITFYFEGRKLIVILSLSFIVYITSILLGFFYPVLIISYTSETARFIDITISFIAVSVVLSIIANIIFTSYRDEKNNNQYLLKELEKQNNKLELLSKTDQLTGVYNRRYYLEVLENEFSYFLKTNKHFYVMMIDIDNFKLINDTYGHLFGDEILKLVANTIKTCLRDHDIISRYGGEEFSIIISHSTDMNGNIIAERIRKSIEELKYRNECSVTVSIGIVKNNINDNVLGILKRADDLLYKAKEKGKNRVVES